MEPDEAARAGPNESAQSTAEGVDFPVHVLAVSAMGLHLLDWLLSTT
jgi:hypothetical protein